MAHEFLSEPWIEAARAIREEFSGKTTAPPHVIRMNLVIQEVPFGDEINAHMDTTGGELQLDIGHLDDPDLTATTDYATAKAIFVEQNQQAGMQAFMAGKIKVDGDMSKMMVMQTAAPTADQEALMARIAEITL